jgi:hypothetical protein
MTHDEMDFDRRTRSCRHRRIRGGEKAGEEAEAVASGQMFCGPQGCRPVAPGCHIEQKTYMGMSGTMNMEVCN